VVRPHGLAGTVVVELWSNVEGRLAAGSVVVAGDRSLTVERSRPSAHSRWLVSFGGVSSHEQAEALRDEVLLAEAVAVEGALWVHEMVGADLLDPAGNPVGRVEAVEANPASDLLVLTDGRVVPLTFVEWRDGRLTVDGPPGLLDR
jgi:16S rRNA processing protein RimM